MNNKVSFDSTIKATFLPVPTKADNIELFHSCVTKGIVALFLYKVEKCKQP